MKSVLISALSAVALLAVAPAANAGSGYVGAAYTRAEVDTGFGDDDADGYGIEGAWAFQATPSLGVQVDGAFTDSDGDDNESYGVTGHVNARNDSYLFGGFVGLADVADETVWSVGLEGEKYYNNVTIAAAAVRQFVVTLPSATPRAALGKILPIRHRELVVLLDVHAGAQEVARRHTCQLVAIADEVCLIVVATLVSHPRPVERAAAGQRGRALEADDARKWRDHPAQYWLERAITAGLPARGGAAEKVGEAWCVKWADGSESPRVCFDARTAEQNPEMEWITLEDPRARAVISELPRFVAGQPLPVIRVTGLPDSVRGIWSLWEISLAAEGLSRKRFLPVFINEEGRPFVPTAKRVWDLLLTETVDVHAVTGAEESVKWFEASHATASTQGERIFTELLTEHRARLKEERERAVYAFEARGQAIGRIGLPAVREHRRKRLQQEHDARMAALDDMEASVPDLNAVMMVRVGGDA